MRRLVVALGILIALNVHGQDTADVMGVWSLQGYVKYLHGTFKVNPLPGYLLDNLVHNRLMMRYAIPGRLVVVADMRNRVFYGDLVKITPDYAGRIERANNDYFDLSFHAIDKPGWLVNSTLDRLYVEYTRGQWELRAGRQRVNWGISTVWNPNDLFNAFAFTDFDYEERPGSDAIRLRRYTGVASSVEVASNLANTWQGRVMAAMLKWNSRGYDWQLLGGFARGDVVIGGGWAGHIKTAGFKTEISYFRPINRMLMHSLSATIGIDYVFANGLFSSVGYLYNSLGSTSGALGSLFAFELSAKNLYPFRHALFVSGMYPVTPLINATTAVIYSPLADHPLFFNPGASLSISQNWDLDLVGQLAFDGSSGPYTSAVRAVFLRIKCSF